MLILPEMCAKLNLLRQAHYLFAKDVLQIDCCTAVTNNGDLGIGSGVLL